jgi:hypothetical protein
MKTTFTLYRYENLIKTNMLYIEELPDERTYYIKVEGDNIEEILERIYLPERLKMDLRNDIVNIVRGYQMLTANMEYTKENNDLCKKYFRDMMDKFCMVHGSFYKFKEDEI